jgi:uncharacterized protein (DUF58 family)
MINASFLDNLKRFSLIVNKHVTSVYSGQRKSAAAGRGISFKDHRIYAYGDDFRAIDWKVFARTDDLYIKNYEEERNLNVHILLDYSASMNFGNPTTKFDYASMIGVGFAYLAMKDNEKFQFATFAERMDVFQPRKGMHQLAAMIDHLNNLKIEGKTDLFASIASYRRMIGSRSLIILISDFLYPIEDIKNTLFMLGKNNIKLVQVLAPQEKDIRLEGDFRLRDIETRDELRTYISPRLVQTYNNMLSDHVAKITDLCNHLGIEFYQMSSDTPIFDAFYELLKK